MPLPFGHPLTEQVPAKYGNTAITGDGRANAAKVPCRQRMQAHGASLGLAWPTARPPLESVATAEKGPIWSIFLDGFRCKGFADEDALKKLLGFYDFRYDFKGPAACP